MKKIIYVIFLSVFLIGCAAKNIQKPSASLNSGNLVQQIQTILADASLSQTRTGLKIVSLKTGKTLYAQNSNQLFHPASNQKLLTTATALNMLGTSFRFKTYLTADSSAVQDSIIQGDLVLVGTGNPDLLSADLETLITQLQQKGIQKITGNIVCDATYFDDLFWGEGWMWDDASAWYWAPISALSINDNCVEVRVAPGEKVGDPLNVSMLPNTKFVKIENNGVTVAPTDSITRKAFKTKRKWKKPENTVVIEGGRTLDDKIRNYTIDIIDAELYVGALLKEMLAENGIECTGMVTTGEQPANAYLLAEHQSQSLSEIVYNTNKASDNLSAEALFKTIGAHYKGAPGTAKKGISAINHYLNSIGVDTTSVELSDGSGVSRYNVVTPNLMIALLTDMHQKFNLQAEFKASLPIAGVDGTLKRRMIGTPAENKLRAKTGSLRGVSSLAGYTTTADGEPIAFSMIMEHFVVKSAKIRVAQDKIGALLSGFKKSQTTGQ